MKIVSCGRAKRAYVSECLNSSKIFCLFSLLNRINEIIAAKICQRKGNFSIAKIRKVFSTL